MHRTNGRPRMGRTNRRVRIRRFPQTRGRTGSAGRELERLKRQLSPLLMRTPIHVAK